MKKYCMLLAAVMMLFVLCSCGANVGEVEWMNDIDRINAEETYPSAPGQLETVYKEVKDIAEDATVVVEVSIISQSVELLGGYPQTHTNALVNSVYKGTLEVGEEITIIEEGGDNGKLMGGIPQLASDNTYFLYLREYKGNYYVCGAFQGRFIVRDGYVFQQATEDVKLTSYEPLNENDYKDLLSEMMSNDSAITEDKVIEK